VKPSINAVAGGGKKAYIVCMKGQINVERQIAYWRKGGLEDWTVGYDLVKRGTTRHGLFFVHLALEKTLKAHVCKATQDFAPKLHTLLVLAQKAALPVSEEQKDFLTTFDRFNIAGRYPESRGPGPTKSEAAKQLVRAQEMFEWLTKQF